MDRLARIAERFGAIETLLDKLETSTSHSHVDKVAAKQLAVLIRLQRLELNADGQNGSGSDVKAQADQGQSEVVFCSSVHERLHHELLNIGISNFRFVKAPPEYYDQPLEFRRDVLQAASINHLCKTIIMENTRAHSSVDGWSNPNNSKYYIVIVQYTARLQAEKLKKFIHKLNGGAIGTKFFNMRLAPQDVSDKLSGYEHNAVTPIGIATPLPVVISHRICELDPPFFWMGAGEVDLKVGLTVRDFLDKYKPFVADCTDD